MFDPDNIKGAKIVLFVANLWAFDERTFARLLTTNELQKVA